MTLSRDERLANLAAANQARHTAKRHDVEDSLAALIKAKEPLNVSRVAQRAGVSRNFVYGQRDLLRAIQDAAAGQPHRLHRPTLTPSTESSLRSRLVNALDALEASKGRIAELEALVERLTGELARAATESVR